MFERGFLSISLVALTLTGLSAGVAAAGLSTGSAATTLGQPLDYPVQVRLDAGESLMPECVGAEVHLSDQRLPSTAVRTVIDQQGAGTARVRVQTQQAIDEPVVSITLRVGCAAPITRRFVVFADPPLAAAVAPPAAPAPPSLAMAQADAVQPPPVAMTNLAGDGKAAGAAAGSVRSRSRAIESGIVRPRPAAPVAPKLAAKAQAVSTVAKQVVVAPPVPAAPGPRLTLEPALPPPQSTELARAEADAVGAALAAVAQAASAAQVAAAAASASIDRMASLERTVTQLRNDAQANQALVAQLREKLDQAQGSSPSLWPLLLLAMTLAGLAAWLAWRLGRLQAVRHVAWMQQSSALAAAQDSSQRPEAMADQQGRAATGASPFMSTDLPTFPPRSGLGSVQTVPGSSVLTPGFATQGTPSSRTAWPAPGGIGARNDRDLPDITPMDTPMARTEPMPAPLRSGESPVRDVSIEELIDLEQQAEFFVVLGQEEAAVDLLVDHLRSTGGGSPLPYLKLLEIYSRTGDRDAYERNRARFNHRFNAYAPEWDSDLSLGRSLEDYPGILPRLEQVWPRPLDAMAELEALLFRKSRGELFELPAYREVLFLYALARDLLDRESVDTGTVDLLLPLTDGMAFGITAPVPFLQEELRPGERDFDFDDRQTGPVDFDLTIPAQQTSIFDPMDEPPRPRRR